MRDNGYERVRVSREGVKKTRTALWEMRIEEAGGQARG